MTYYSFEDCSLLGYLDSFPYDYLVDGFLDYLHSFPYNYVLEGLLDYLQNLPYYYLLEVSVRSFHLVLVCYLIDYL